ncbi:MAG: hypothetical protein NTW96_00935, partial [Planctomycetia bacterium]|nr:hypothetical protein [Planctomycetia bacterium]
MFPRWTWFVVAAAAVFIGALHGTDLVGDRGAANSITMVVGVLVLAVVLAWFTFFSWAARRWRLIVGGASALSQLKIGIGRRAVFWEAAWNTEVSHAEEVHCALVETGTQHVAGG